MGLPSLIYSISRSSLELEHVTKILCRYNATKMNKLFRFTVFVFRFIPRLYLRRSENNVKNTGEEKYDGSQREHDPPFVHRSLK